MDTEDALLNLLGMAFIVCALIGVVTVVRFFFYPSSAEVLAQQIADGTHEVVWSTNEFGTKEVRIVEITYD